MAAMLGKINRSNPVMLGYMGLIPDVRHIMVDLGKLNRDNSGISGVIK